MLKVEITGETPQELYANAASFFILLAHGGQNMFAAPPADLAPAPVEPKPNAQQDVPSQVAEPVGDVTKLPEEFEKVRKNARKPAVTIEAKPIPEGGDEVPDLTGKAAPLDYAKDCKPLILALIKKKEAELYAAQKIDRAAATKEQSDAVMTQTMAFMQGLFKPFGVKKGPDLKPEQLAEFKATMEKHL